MEQEIAKIEPSETSIEELQQQGAERALFYWASAKADATLRAYKSDWKSFQVWALKRRIDSMVPVSPSIIVMYIAWLADSGRKVSTIQRHLAAITYAHDCAEVEIPTRHIKVREAMKGIRHRIGIKQTPKEHIPVKQLRNMLDELPNSLIGHRNRALLLLGFAGAFRRSELVALDVEDIDQLEEGFEVTIRKSKTDQDSHGQIIGIPGGTKVNTDPIEAVKRWLKEAGITTGAIFRHIDRHGNLYPDRLADRTVARIVKECAEAAGYDPKIFAGHSLRSGFVTEAAKGGASDHEIQQTTRHRSTKSLEHYKHPGKRLGKDNALRKTGL